MTEIEKIGADWFKVTTRKLDGGQPSVERLSGGRLLTTMDVGLRKTKIGQRVMTILTYED